MANLLCAPVSPPQVSLRLLVHLAFVPELLLLMVSQVPWG